MGLAPGQAQVGHQRGKAQVDLGRLLLPGQQLPEAVVDKKEEKQKMMRKTKIERRMNTNI